MPTLSKTLTHTVSAHVHIHNWDRLALFGPLGCLLRGEYFLTLLTSLLCGLLAGLATAAPVLAGAILAVYVLNLGFVLSAQRCLRFAEAGFALEE